MFADVTKLAGWMEDDHQLFHYRDKDQNEVGLVVENAAGDIVCIEVKAAASVNATDFRGLDRLATACGTRFRCGLLLHDGDVVLPFGKKLWAAPIASLWAPDK